MLWGILGVGLIRIVAEILPEVDEQMSEAS
jgi:hypothetical protein